MQKLNKNLSFLDSIKTRTIHSCPENLSDKLQRRTVSTSIKREYFNSFEMKESKKIYLENLENLLYKEFNQNLEKEIINNLIKYAYIKVSDDFLQLLDIMDDNSILIIPKQFENSIKLDKKVSITDDNQEIYLLGIINNNISVYVNPYEINTVLAFNNDIELTYVKSAGSLSIISEATMSPSLYYTQGYILDTSKVTTKCIKCPIINVENSILEKSNNPKGISTDSNVLLIDFNTPEYNNLDYSSLYSSFSNINHKDIIYSDIQYNDETITYMGINNLAIRDNKIYGSVTILNTELFPKSPKEYSYKIRGVITKKCNGDSITKNLKNSSNIEEFPFDKIIIEKILTFDIKK
jgi:hypothetical protein